MPEERPFELHHMVKCGALARVREICTADNLNAEDGRGYTPLAYAVESPKATAEMVGWLLERGAEIRQEFLSLCLRGGDRAKFALLIDHGADVHYNNALLDAVWGRNMPLELLRTLLAHGVPLNTVTEYKESALRVLSREGRFDAVALLLDAGADESQLAWTPLIRAVALGSPADVQAILQRGVPLEETDWWNRTAYLVAVITGDIDKARLLLDAGADPRASGRCGQTPLIHAIESHKTSMLEWLLENGADIEQTDSLERTPLMTAVEAANLEAVEILLRAGAAVDRAIDRKFDRELTASLIPAGVDLSQMPETVEGRPALDRAQNAAIVRRLLEAGADPAYLSQEGRRALLGLDPEPDDAYLDVTREEFEQGWSPGFGTGNPEEIVEPFWEAMIRAGVSAYAATTLYGRPGSPVFCAQRFGQSLTLLPDGRIVQIGGEHEDSYDSDFCIYNDVFVHDPGGAIHIFGYPEEVFPPTDFHTATLLNGRIYIIGALGYQGGRQHGTTPVFVLDTATFRIERLDPTGEAPGWLSRHRAQLIGPHEIRVSGGKIDAADGGRETYIPNHHEFILDTRRLLWRIG